MQNLGNAYVEKKEYEKAVQFYAQALQYDPKNTDIRHNLAVVYLNLELYQDSAAEYTLAIESNPKNASAHNGLAVCSYMLKDFKTSKRHAVIAKKLGFKVDKKLLK